MKVRFTEVGREKKTWEEDIPTPDGTLCDRDLEKSVRKHAALRSSDIEFSDDGEILVGLCRQVGRWEILPEVV